MTQLTHLQIVALREAVEKRVIIDALTTPFHFQCVINGCGRIVQHPHEMVEHARDHLNSNPCNVCGQQPQRESMIAHCIAMNDREHVALTWVADVEHPKHQRAMEATWLQGQLEVQKRMLNRLTQRPVGYGPCFDVIP